MSNLEHTPDALAQDIILSRVSTAHTETAIHQPKARLVTMSDVEPEEIRWIWYPVLAAGKLTMLSSDPGCGKSTVTLDIASRLSLGLPWPVTGDRPNVGSTIFLSAEDDPRDTIRPRIDAAGGDPSKIHVLTAACDYGSDGGAIERSLNLAVDIDAVVEAIEQVGDCRLVVIDPISAYMGGVDSHKNADVRGILTPLVQMAQRYELAVLCVTHLNKGGGKAIYRSIGSIAYTAAARLEFSVGKDVDDPQRRLMVPTKTNITPDALGFGYRVTSALSNPAVGAVEWEPDPVTETAEVLFARETDSIIKASDDADSLFEVAILDLLSNGVSHSFVDIKTALSEQAGKIGDKSLRKLLKKLGATCHRDGFQGNVLWRIPEPATE